MSTTSCCLPALPFEAPRGRHKISRDLAEVLRLRGASGRIPANRQPFLPTWEFDRAPAHDDALATNSASSSMNRA